MAKTFKFDPKAEAEKLGKLILAHAKRVTCHVGECMVYEVDAAARAWEIAVESPDQLGFDLEDIIKTSKHGHLIASKEIPGQYDWVSDTYIKDCSLVQFILKP